MGVCTLWTSKTRFILVPRWMRSQSKPHRVAAPSGLGCLSPVPPPPIKSLLQAVEVFLARREGGRSSIPETKGALFFLLQSADLGPRQLSVLKNKSQEDGNFSCIDFPSANYSHLLQLTCLMALLRFRLLCVAWPDKEKGLLGGGNVHPAPPPAQPQLLARARGGRVQGCPGGALAEETHCQAQALLPEATGGAAGRAAGPGSVAAPLPSC